MNSFKKFGLIGGLLLSAAACDAPTGEAPASSGQVRIGQISFIESPQVKVVSNLQLNQDIRKAFEEFKSDPSAHGAFYLAINGSKSAWTNDLATAADAQKVANLLCEYAAKTKCSLYAVLEPGPNDAPNALPLYYKEDLGPAIRNNSRGKRLAIALTSSGAYGYSANFDHESGARKAAMDECKKAVNRSRTNTAKPLRKAFQNAGFYACRIHISI